MAMNGLESLPALALQSVEHLKVDTPSDMIHNSGDRSRTFCYFIYAELASICRMIKMDSSWASGRLSRWSMSLAKEVGDSM
jgi:hypothetical protein